MSKTTTSPQGNFIALLQAKREGVTLTQIDAELADLVTKVDETGRPATLTYVLKIGKSTRGIVLVDELKVQEPKPIKEHSHFYVLPGGALTRNDPSQPDLPNLHVVRDDAGDKPKTVNA